jgi:hypothetical protein
MFEEMLLHCDKAMIAHDLYKLLVWLAAEYHLSSYQAPPEQVGLLVVFLLEATLGFAMLCTARTSLAYKGHMTVWKRVEADWMALTSADRPTQFYSPD